MKLAGAKDVEVPCICEQMAGRVVLAVVVMVVVAGRRGRRVDGEENSRDGSLLDGTSHQRGRVLCFLETHGIYLHIVTPSHHHLTSMPLLHTTTAIQN
ncbi:hypothetical protein E2C01_088988 [Portunus trituberculatus]|uniref:Uncharacterized protein n=1 Tax=Portunus trituberculatus TaxID=210409 RepID=A0A5B7JHJ0_PORTR|nr:hypothetical protein [Portunus trituberculatus]